MKRKGLWIGMIAALALGAGTLGANALHLGTASATSTSADLTAVTIGGQIFDLSSFETYEKAAIRLDTERSGIRFTSGLDKEVYNKLVALDEADDTLSVTFGTIITYHDYVSGATDFTKAALDAQYAASLPEGKTAYVDCKADKFLSDGSKSKQMDDTYREYTAVLLVQEANYEEQLSARAYISVVENDKETLYYADYDAANSRSAAQVAGMAIADYTEYADNVTKLEILKKYVNEETSGAFTPANELFAPQAEHEKNDATLETVTIGDRDNVTKLTQASNANQWVNRLETKFLSPSVKYGEGTALGRINAVGYRYMVFDFYYKWGSFMVKYPSAVGATDVNLVWGELANNNAGETWYEDVMVYDADGNYTRKFNNENWYTVVIDISENLGVADLAAPQVCIIPIGDNNTNYFDNVRYYCNDSWKTDLGVRNVTGTVSELTLHAGDGATSIGEFTYKGEAVSEYEVKVADETVATYADGGLTPLKAGTTKVTVSVNGSEYEIAVTVTEAYVQAANSEMFTWFAHGSEDTVYGEYNGAVGGRTGVYEMNGPDSSADWANKLAVWETNHTVSTADYRAVFEKMQANGYAYVTFDMYFSATGTGVYVYAPDGAGEHTYAVFVAGKSTRRNNTSISLYYEGVDWTEQIPLANRWYTVVVKYEIPEAVNGDSTIELYPSIQLNWNTGAGSIYLDNLRYWYNNTDMITKVDYIQRDGSEFEYFSLPTSGETSCTLSTTEVVGREGVYNYTCTAAAGWNAKLTLKETNFSASGLGSNTAVNDNITALGIRYITFDICMNETSTFELAAGMSSAWAGDRINSNVITKNNTNITVYDASGNSVTQFENNVWYTVVVEYAWSGSGYVGVFLGSTGSNFNMSLDNVRYYFNDTWKADLNVA